MLKILLIIIPFYISFSHLSIPNVIEKMMNKSDTHQQEKTLHLRFKASHAVLKTIEILELNIEGSGDNKEI